MRSIIALQHKVGVMILTLHLDPSLDAEEHIANSDACTYHLSITSMDIAILMLSSTSNPQATYHQNKKF